jgi:hypothetical protein
VLPHTSRYCTRSRLTYYEYKLRAISEHSKMGGHPAEFMQYPAALTRALLMVWACAQKMKERKLAFIKLQAVHRE